MIVCVSLVSNSRGCCLAAPGDHEGAATILSTAANILLMKNNLKFESRATAVSVAMSPRYRGGKYRSRLHPRSRKCTWHFFAGDWSCEIDNEVNHAVCLQAEFQMHAVLTIENDKFYTTMIYSCFSRSVCFSMGPPAWWRFGLCSSGSSLVSRWGDARARANFKCDVADVTDHWGHQVQYDKWYQVQYF